MCSVGEGGRTPSSLQTYVCTMDLISSSHLTWGRFLNRFRFIATSLWPPPSKSSALCSCLSLAYILEKTLLLYCKVAVASSGIAATLLAGG
ncbi:hypothetical protein TNCV_3108361 [Trichonephila clavipes]|uniref:Uncharacterized protein n=1 Tax=Trichonephila clavipes TaxID=2585209 RepID=A0A8X6V615_TRICX|nr:hypothetical protein TNCV_3108361 [Trichonephila clavipes]